EPRHDRRAEPAASRRDPQRRRSDDRAGHDQRRHPADGEVTEDKSTRYHRLKRRADIAGLLWGAALLLLLSSTGAARALRDLARHLAGGEFYSTVALVVLAVVLLNEVVGLRLAWYSGFVLERRYELSRQSAGAWAADHLKSTVLTALLAIGGALIVYTAMV